jgi:hypothetical protein
MKASTKTNNPRPLYGAVIVPLGAVGTVGAVVEPGVAGVEPAGGGKVL